MRKTSICDFFRRMQTVACAVLCMLAVSACGGDDNSSSGGGGGDTPSGGDEEEPTATVAFAKGADVSWLTEMESSGWKFYSADGKAGDCLSILQGMGVNAIRLRVWVNPSDGWCNKADVVAKAERAKTLGMPVMIDFHYSDSWADPSKQNPPTAWKDYTVSEMRKAIADHTTDVLTALKAKGVSVQWVQVGNETSGGMLWPKGEAKGTEFTNFALFVNAGYEAVKAVYSKAQVIVHLDRGNELAHFTWMFDGLRGAGAKWDVIGASLYPEDSDWEALTESCLSNLATLHTRYSCPVMVSEVGMSWDATNAAAMMTKLVKGCKAIDGCLGVFYWEPECYNGWKGYTKGAFDNTGKPTSTLGVFSEKD